VKPGSDAVLYAHGDPQWMHDRPSRETNSTAAAPSPDPIFYVREPNRAAPLRFVDSVPTGRHQRGVAPSGREGETIRNVGAIFARSPASRAMTRGALLHAMLAQVQWLDGPEAWSERRLDRLRPLCPDVKLWRAAIAELNQMVRQPQLAELLNRSSYLARVAARIPADHLAFDSLSVAVETERAFAIREDGGPVVTGSIDRCVQVHGGGALQFVEVIDFKTDAIARQDAADLDAHVRFYQPQAAAYRRAAARIFAIPESQVWATLVFTTIDLAVDVR
jgi:ATP-dependent exoDNAse (exonuclease V) beta subunit